MSETATTAIVLLTIFIVVFVGMLLARPRKYKCDDGKEHQFGFWQTQGQYRQMRTCSKCGWTERAYVPE